MSQKIPATIITGFLGAGKTSLVRHVLAHSGDKRIALIINEFGDLGIDGELIKGCGIENCRDEDIVELANGCICCTVADEFIPTMQALLAREERVDHIIIETSGLALPQPLVRAFNWPEIKAEITIDAIITLVDAAALDEGRFAMDEGAIKKRQALDEMLDHDTPLGELFEDQLVCADLIVVNKIDLVDERALERITGLIKTHKRSGASIVCASNGEVDVKAMLGLGLGAEDDFIGRESHHDLHHAGEPHTHDDFTSFSLKFPPNGSRAELLDRIENTIKAHDILRLKGFVAIKNSAARLIVQAVGPRVNSWFDRPWGDGEKVETSLVVIGKNPLDQKAIEKGLQATD